MQSNEAQQDSHVDTSRLLKDVARLQTNRSFRDRRRAFFVEGVRNFVQALDQGFVVEQVIYSEKLLIVPIARKLVRRCRRAGVSTLCLSPEAFRAISKTKTASGIAAIFQQRWGRLGSITPGRHLFWTLVETVRSPGNLGTLIRSSAAAGGGGFVFVGKTIDPYAPTVIRAAMGAVYKQEFVRSDWREVKDWMAHTECEAIGAEPSGDVPMHAVNYPSGIPLLVLGDERKGLTEQQAALCRKLVHIPMQDGCDSLNLGVAGSLLMYEIYRGYKPDRTG